MSLSLIFIDDWIPGNSFGFPGFISAGNFSGYEYNEILLISAIPEKTDVITLVSEDLEIFHNPPFDQEVSTLMSQDRLFLLCFEINVHPNSLEYNSIYLYSQGYSNII